MTLELYCLSLLTGLREWETYEHHVLQRDKKSEKKLLQVWGKSIGKRKEERKDSNYEK